MVTLTGTQTIILTLGAAAISATAAIVAGLISSLLQGRHAKQSYLRQLREAQLKELRDAYGVLISVVEGWQQVIRQRTFLLAGQTKEQRDT